MNGVVTRFLFERGYGFLTDLATGQEWFFHQNNCESPVSRGTKVTFRLGEYRGRACAIRVKAVDGISTPEVQQ